MKIDKYQSYILDDYEFINFVRLDSHISEQIRQWRNHPEIRNVMYSKEEISEGQHNIFMNSLRISDSKFYWLVKKTSTPIGVVSLVDFNHVECEGQSGFYLFPEYLNNGLGLEFIGKITHFLFKVIGCRKLYGRIMISNKNSMMINYLLGFDIKPEIIEINGEKFVEVLGKADNFSQHFTTTFNGKEILKQIRDFNKLYQQIKCDGNKQIY